MQQVPIPTLRRAAAFATVVALSTLVVATSASAALLDTVLVDLIALNGTELDPLTPISLIQLAPLATGVLAVNLGGAGPISNFMLDDERITFSGNSILIRVGAASVNGLNPGFGAGARYELTGLAVAGEVITGFTAYAFDGYGTTGTFTGLAPGVLPSLVQLGVNADSISFKLDNTLTFVDRGLGGSLNYAEFRIDLLSQPIPEPGTWLMMLAGLGGLAGMAARRRSQRV